MRYYVYELDYRDELEALDQDHLRAKPAPSALIASWFAVLALKKFIVALVKGSRRGIRFRAQLLLGTLCVVLLFLAAFYSILVLVGLALTEYFSITPKGFWGFLNPDGIWLGATSTLAGGSYIIWRRKILRSSRRVRQVQEYLRSRQDDVSGVVDSAIDSLRELKSRSGQRAISEIHLLAYSFGSLVVLDALAPRNPLDLAKYPAHWSKEITTLTTVGCPRTSSVCMNPCI